MKLLFVLWIAFQPMASFAESASNSSASNLRQLTWADREAANAAISMDAESELRSAKETELSRLNTQLKAEEDKYSIFRSAAKIQQLKAEIARQRQLMKQSAEVTNDLMCKFDSPCRLLKASVSAGAAEQFPRLAKLCSHLSENVSADIRCADGEWTQYKVKTRSFSLGCGKLAEFAPFGDYSYTAVVEITQLAPFRYRVGDKLKLFRHHSTEGTNNLDLDLNGPTGLGNAEYQWDHTTAVLDPSGRTVTISRDLKPVLFCRYSPEFKKRWYEKDF